MGPGRVGKIARPCASAGGQPSFFPRTGAGTGAREPRLPRRGGQSPGRGRGLQPREPRELGAPRAGSPGAAPPTQSTPRRGENSFIAFPSPRPPPPLSAARRAGGNSRQRLQVPLSSGRQQQEPGGGCCSARRGAGDALGRSGGRGARTRRERACACVCVRAPDCVRPLSRVTGTNSLGFSRGCARPARRSLATAPLKKPMVKVLLSKCS